MFMNYKHHVSIPSLFPNTCFNANTFENLIIKFMGDAHSFSSFFFVTFFFLEKCVQGNDDQHIVI